jgi:hypothetical protein
MSHLDAAERLLSHPQMTSTGMLEYRPAMIHAILAVVEKLDELIEVTVGVALMGEEGDE